MAKQYSYEKVSKILRLTKKAIRHRANTRGLGMNVFFTQEEVALLALPCGWELPSETQVIDKSVITYHIYPSKINQTTNESHGRRQR